VDQGGDGGFGGFYGGFVAEVAEGLAGDGADGGEGDVGGEGQVGGLQKGDEVAGCRCAGEGDGIGVVGGVAEEALESGDGFGGDLVAVGFGDGDGGTGGGEDLGKVVAGFGGADEEEGSAGGFGKEGFGEGFGDVVRGDEVDGEADGLDCFCCGWAYDGYTGEWLSWPGEGPCPRVRIGNTRSCCGL